MLLTLSADLGAGCQIDRVLSFTGNMLYLSDNTDTGTSGNNDGDNYANTAADVQV